MHQVVIKRKKLSYKSCYQCNLKQAKEFAKSNGHNTYLGQSDEVIEQGVHLKTKTKFHYFT